MKLSVCVLLYGDHPQLAHRCLESIWSRLAEGQEVIQDIRLGLNVISPSTRAIVDWFTDGVQRHYRLPVLQYEPLQNACKYPLMRRMLLHDVREPAPLVMWFDDDSYLSGGPGWWQQLLRKAATCDMLGKIYRQGMRPRQWDWIVRQRWYVARKGQSTRWAGRPAFSFATGGWWVIRSAILRTWDWPSPELKHCGGDSMLGELLRHTDSKLLNFDEGVQINADERGRHSKAKPRGESIARKLLGAQGWQPRPDVSHQQFQLERRCYGCE